MQSKEFKNKIIIFVVSQTRIPRRNTLRLLPTWLKYSWCDLIRGFHVKRTGFCPSLLALLSTLLTSLGQISYLCLLLTCPCFLSSLGGPLCRREAGLRPGVWGRKACGLCQVLLIFYSILLYFPTYLDSMALLPVGPTRISLFPYLVIFLKHKIDVKKISNSTVIANNAEVVWDWLGILKTVHLGVIDCILLSRILGGLVNFLWLACWESFS